MADVLLIEDNATFRAMLTDVIEELGHRVHPLEAAESVTGALLSQVRPSLVIADLILPGISGDKLCSALQRVRRALGLKVLLISDLEEEVLAQRARDCGADGYATK